MKTKSAREEKIMKTRTEHEILEMLLSFSKEDERIRITVINGSRANPNATRDIFQDYDIASFVTDVAPFRNETYVLPRFGESLVVEQPLIGPWPPDDADGSYHNYNIQLLDGNRIDLSFCPLSSLDEKLRDSLTQVLLDKDNMVSSLPDSNESSYYLSKPNRDLFQGCCIGFFFTLGSHIPKTIWRKQLSLLKFYIEACLRDSLIMMLGWEIGIRTGWEKSIGSRGKYLQKYMTPKTWEDYRNTFAGNDYSEIWESLFLSLEIFTRAAKFVAEQLDLCFREDQALKVKAHLEHVRALASDAKRIYDDK